MSGRKQKGARAAASILPTKEQIADALLAADIGPCPRCRSTSFALAEGVQMLTNVQSNPDGSLAPTPPIPTAVTICGGCGAIYQHAVLALLTRASMPPRPAIEVPRGPRLVVP